MGFWFLGLNKQMLFSLAYRSAIFNLIPVLLLLCPCRHRVLLNAISNDS